MVAVLAQTVCIPVKNTPRRCQEWTETGTVRALTKARDLCSTLMTIGLRLTYTTVIYVATSGVQPTPVPNTRTQDTERVSQAPSLGTRIRV